ncbi:ribose-5-phosphate isomerase [Salpingoeca rosetta]|uniref:ribose-5-phosphate isomerase n=1 Tax=Salpingoeca rosetta (strain ATCC 50818 / BSB-021) TaxID=946362 RepID=F2UBB3_SALR5|nr:ribose-5-phosphate isomerase [Salpingoeca rosetta]EGD73779.1 ribose-5-phosphate isomerase [Salpingoeca rosetta]|eukprot:XP_004993342.1 ribose-5-phosphate isomerase [Salpingoeca rosetta]
MPVQPVQVAVAAAALAGKSAKDAGKLRAAYAAVDRHVKDKQVIGIGSGSTIVFAVDRLAERVREENLTVQCVPTSFQAIQLIRQHNLPLSDLSATPKIDVAIDGADEMTPDLACIKGGGGCLVQEKIVAYNSDTFVLIADGSKESDALGTKWTRGVPIEVIPMAYVPIQKQLEGMGATAKLRMATSKAGPCVTDNGNFIIDAHFGALQGDSLAPAALEKTLCMIPGVVDCGLFVGMAKEAFIGREDGTVMHYTRD